MYLGMNHGGLSPVRVSSYCRLTNRSTKTHRFGFSILTFSQYCKKSLSEYAREHVREVRVLSVSLRHFLLCVDDDIKLPDGSMRILRSIGTRQIFVTISVPRFPVVGHSMLRVRYMYRIR